MPTSLSQLNIRFRFSLQISKLMRKYDCRFLKLIIYAKPCTRNDVDCSVS